MSLDRAIEAAAKALEAAYAEPYETMGYQARIAVEAAAPHLTYQPGPNVERLVRELERRAERAEAEVERLRGQLRLAHADWLLEQDQGHMLEEMLNDERALADQLAEALKAWAVPSCDVREALAAYEEARRGT